MVEHNLRLDASNILELIEPYDIVVDGADNFPTRYLLNDASVRLRKPVVSASILGFEGQISTFVPFDGPCYRCLFPTPPPPELAPSCGANGVLGVMAGVMGLLQANEVIKLAAGIGEPLKGRLLLYDSLGTRFTELKVRRDPDCPICGPARRRTSPRRRWASSPTTSSSAAPRRASPRRRDARAPETPGCAGFIWRDRIAHADREDPPGAALEDRRRGRGLADGATVGDVLSALAEAHPDTREQLFGDDGELNRYVNVYLNDEDVRVLDGLDDRRVATPTPS